MSTVVSIDKRKVRQSFSSAAKTYDGLATLQRKVGVELSNNSALNESCVDKIVLDIGCGTGFFTQKIQSKLTPRQTIAIDIALPMVQVAKTKLKQMDAICADAEYLPFMDKSVDKIVSNLALQWSEKLFNVFTGFNRVLKQDGSMFFSTFGPATLRELKQSWAEVDNYTHVNDFYSVDELIIFLQKTEFKNIKIETKYYQSTYPTVIELMRELKGIGAHNVLSGRNRKMTSKTQMQNMLDAYEKHRINRLIPATYEIIFVSARKR
ncbi:MAG: malonyl-ACP O-methyltransferase BioC [Methylococcales bacterium]|nr:malonyl-ACP O-methyltransferase BioC [Methylococcales bacterium]